MQRFINDPTTAQSNFTHYAMKTHPMNSRGTFMRGGIRI